MPRVVIAAPASGQGKTTVATGLIAALRARSLTVSPHKVGPDYIDSTYHGLAAGRPGRNLDPWLVDEQLVAPLFVHGATTPTRADIAIIEGVMGLFDGKNGADDFASTAHVARLLHAPVILVVDASAMAGSIAALVAGFAGHDPRVRLGGVIANRVGSPGHAALLRDALAPSGIPILGAIPRHEALTIPSRHLGLIPAPEQAAAARAVITDLAGVITASVDLDAVQHLAAAAPPLHATSPIPPAIPPRTRMAVATGAAFTFGYTENLELLAAAGAEAIPLDPTCDRALPEHCAGLIIGGGFPEAHAGDLCANLPLRAAIKAAAAAGMPIAAECAGLLYLSRTLDGAPMCAVLDADATMTGRLTLGYRTAIAPGDSALAAAGTRVRGHEFHHSVLTPPAGPSPAWLLDSGRTDGFATGNVHASYLHLNWAGAPDLARRFAAACHAFSAVST